MRKLGKKRKAQETGGGWQELQRIGKDEKSYSTTILPSFSWTEIFAGKQEGNWQKGL